MVLLVTGSTLRPPDTAELIAARGIPGLATGTGTATGRVLIAGDTGSQRSRSLSSAEDSNYQQTARAAVVPSPPSKPAQLRFGGDPCTRTRAMDNQTDRAAARLPDGVALAVVVEFGHLSEDAFADG